MEDAAVPFDCRLSTCWSHTRIMHRDAAQRQVEIPQRHNEDNSFSLERRNYSDQFVQTRAGSISKEADELSCKPAVAIRTTEDTNMRVELCDASLWEEFSFKQNEMIVTKIGRRMFPTFRLKCSNLDPNEKYCVMMELVNIDNSRYKFQDTKWVRAGDAESKIPSRLYVHPESPATGQQWMKGIVSFHKIKLTNFCGNSEPGTFLVHSMHRYQPRVHFARTADVAFLSRSSTSIFAFPQTAFISVTAYQNNEVTSLKIQHNPFARGFRVDGGKARSSEYVSPLMHHLPKNVATQLVGYSEPERKRPRSDFRQLPSAILSQPGFASYSMVSDQPHPARPFPIRQLETCQGQTRSADGHSQQPKGFSQTESSSRPILDSKSQSSGQFALQRGQTSLLPSDRGSSADGALTEPCNYQNVYPTATQSGILDPQNFNGVSASDRYNNWCTTPARNYSFQGMVSNSYTYHGTSTYVHQMPYNSQHPSLHSEPSYGGINSMCCSASEASHFPNMAQENNNALSESHIPRHVQPYCEALRDPVMAYAANQRQVSPNESIDSGYISNAPVGHDGGFAGPSSAYEYQPLNSSSVGSTSMANVSNVPTESRPTVLSTESSTPLNLSWS